MNATEPPRDARSSGPRAGAPAHPLVPLPGEALAVDPRRALPAHELALASRNAFPVVARHVQRRDAAGTGAGVVVAILIGAASYWTLSQQRATPLPPAVAAAPLQAAQPEPAPLAALPPPAPQPTLPAPGSDALQPRLSAPTLVLDLMPAPESAPAPKDAAAKAGAAPSTAKSGAQPLSSEESFVERMSSASVDRASATPLADPGHTIVQGTLIAGVLETALDSDLPGYARAVVSEDVRAFDGVRVLVPRGSRLIGQYKSGLANGQKRAYVLWTRLIRPDGASIALASPATDFAGNTGLAGEVDTHFFARFGSAMLLSVVDVLGAIGSSTSLVVSGSQSAASVAAQRDAQIPPTVNVAQGTPIRIFTARDLDFASVEPAALHGAAPAHAAEQVAAAPAPAGGHP